MDRSVPKSRKEEGKMKKSKLVFVMVGIFIAGVFAGQTARGEQKVLRYAGQLPVTHHLTQADNRFAKMVEEKTNGRVKVEVYPAGQLYKGTSILKSIMSGAIEMGVTYNGTWTGSVPLMDLFDLNFLFKDYQQVEKAWRGKIGDKLREEMEKYNVKALGFGAYGESFSILNKKKTLKRPEDFKGLKIRANQPMAADSVKALGASPVMMASSEVYMALQRGTIDGATSGPTTFVQRKWFEVTEYVTIAYSSYSLWPVMINLKIWNTLPQEVQKALEEAGLDYTKHTIQMADSEDEKAVKFLSEKLKFYKLNDEDRKAWEQAMVPVREAFIQRTGDAGKDLLNWAGEL
jgi:tripartite ATP-independent transporter DctP family solute receptor